MPREAPTRRRLRNQLILGAAIGVVVVVSLTAIIATKLNPPDEGLTPQQRTLILKLQSVLLHDSPDPQYARVSLQPDDRGYVAGIGDFATSDGSALKVIDAYTARVGANVLSRDYGPVLARLDLTGSSDTADLEGYADAWRSTSRDPVFRQAQDSVLQASYLEPSIATAREQNVRSPLGVAVFLDSLLQHGQSGPDGLPALIVKTNTALGRPAGETAEQEWIATFLDLREAVLLSPAEAKHKQLWPLTTGRVDALRRLVESGAWDLAPPVSVNAYGLTHRLDASPPQVALPSRLPSPSATDSTAAQPSSPTSSPTSSPATTRSTPGGANPPPTTASPSAPSTTPGSVTLPREGAIVGIGGLCLDLDAARPDPGRHVKIWTCNQTSAQYWFAATDATVRILGACLKPRDGSGLPGTKIEVHPCDPSDASQRWLFDDGRIRHTASDRCLAVPDDTTELGVQVVLANCADRPGQYWTPPQ